VDVIQGTIFGLAVTAGAVFAWRNLRLGRANRRGAARLAAFTLAATLLVWLWTARHTAAVRDEVALLAVALGKGLILAGYFVLLYLAVEPAVRRRWPHRVVGWSRLLEGRLRDPLVGRDVLIGGAVGVVCVLLHRLQFVAAAAAGFPAFLVHLNLEVVNDQLGHLVLYPTFALLVTLHMFFLFFVLARVLRREWAAALVMAALFAVPLLFADPLTWVAGLAITLVIAIVVGVIVQFGLLPLFFGNLFVCLLLNTPVTLNVRAWYGPAGLVFMLAAAALAAYGCVVALGGRPLLAGGVFGDD
jgi:hypothetical protein